LPKINDLDSQILKTLLKDGRIGYNEIAKQNRVSKNKVWKRCRVLEQRGVISGATIQINFSHFGFEGLATLLIAVDAQLIEQAMDFIEKITEVRAYRQYNNVYNIRAVATLRDLNELDHIKELIKRKLPTTGLKTYIWTGVRNIPENLNLTESMNPAEENAWQQERKRVQRSNELVTIDPLDNQIVNKLTMNGRSSFTEIAKEIKVSTDTVVKRYHKLREADSIKVCVQINPKQIGYSSILDFNIAFTTLGGLSDTVIDSLTQIPDVIVITKISGDYDVQLTAMVRDVAESFAIQDKISRINGITKIEVSARKIRDQWPTAMQYISTI